jgi:hypothetical protein
MKYSLAVFCLLLISCAKTPEGLTVSTYHLRESMFQENDDPMVRGEVQRYLHGTVTLEERLQKIGQYYHVTWKQSDQQPTDLVDKTEVVFEYMQAASGSQIKRIVQRAQSPAQVDAYFTIAGNDYAKNGRVLAWRISVRNNGQTLDSKQSYLWR